MHNVPNMASNLDKMTIGAGLRELGVRIARIRLGRNLTQAALARESGASERSVARLEAGENVSLDTFLRILTVLGLADQFANFLPNPEIRPVERVSALKQERRRAHIRKKEGMPKTVNWSWGDEG